MWRHCLLLALVCAPAARADIALLVQEASGRRGVVTHAGHASVYLSGVCAETPVKLRLCGPGEDGVILSKYPGYAPGAPYEWLALPPLAFLYGVETPEHIPYFATPALRAVLQQRYWERHLQPYLPALEPGQAPPGEWREVIGAAYKRDIYFFRLRTRPADDRRYIELRNGTPNSGSFNLFWQNCADFAKRQVHFFHPQALRRDYINDFGMTTPKGLAKSLTRYARHYPDAGLTVERLTQTQGNFARSWPNRHVTELPLGSWRHALILGALRPSWPLYAVGTYLATGFFSTERALREHPAPLTPEHSLLARWYTAGTPASESRQAARPEERWLRQHVARAMALVDENGAPVYVWTEGESDRSAGACAANRLLGEGERLARAARLMAERQKRASRPTPAELAAIWAERPANRVVGVE